MSASELQTLLEAGDVGAYRQAFARVFPHLPQPQSAEEAAVQFHMTRTQTASIALKHRAYSHAWLRERSLPSQLPDPLRAKAERMYPVIVEGVGVSINFSNPLLAPAAERLTAVINDAIEDCYASGRKSPEFVAARMAEAKRREMKALFGGVGR